MSKETKARDSKIRDHAKRFSDDEAFSYGIGWNDCRAHLLEQAGELPEFDVVKFDDWFQLHKLACSSLAAAQFGYRMFYDVYTQQAAREGALKEEIISWKGKCVESRQMREIDENELSALREQLRLIQLKYDRYYEKWSILNEEIERLKNGK